MSFAPGDNKNSPVALDTGEMRELLYGLVEVVYLAHISRFCG